MEFENVVRITVELRGRDYNDPPETIRVGSEWRHSIVRGIKVILPQDRMPVVIVEFSQGHQIVIPDAQIGEFEVLSGKA